MSVHREVMYVAYIGELFLRMLKALILPLIVPSLITAVGSLDMSLSGKVKITDNRRSGTGCPTKHDSW